MIGERLWDLRKEAGMTQDELAEVLHINKHSISSYERSKSEPPDDVKIAIASHFHVSVDYLLGITDDPTPASGERGLLRLPKGFPSEAKNELMSYAEFLMQKYK